MMCFMGHGGALAAIFMLLVSTTFLVWVAGKTGNPLQKFGKAIGWIAFVLTAAITVCSLICQAKTCMSGGCGSKKGCGMMGGEKGMGDMMMMHQMMGDEMMKPAEKMEKK